MAMSYSADQLVAEAVEEVVVVGSCNCKIRIGTTWSEKVSACVLYPTSEKNSRHHIIGTVLSSGSNW